jgi:membrane associated rhomboid family serine protease
MSSGADLFVVCKQCGSEVSPYVTECPYCGHRLRRRAPKLPRDGGLKGTATGPSPRSSRRWRPHMPKLAPGRMRRGQIAGIRADAPAYATIALVLASCALWIATKGGYLELAKLPILGPLRGDWWRLLTWQFANLAGFAGSVYLFSCMLAVAIFGWLGERRHGPLVVLALFFGAGVTAGLLAEAVYPLPLLLGANAGALALLAAWAVPDLQDMRRRQYYDGDLLGTAAIAAVLLAMPLALGDGVSWLAGVTGGIFGLLMGLGLSRVRTV